MHVSEAIGNVFRPDGGGWMEEKEAVEIFHYDCFTFHFQFQSVNGSLIRRNGD